MTLAKKGGNSPQEEAGSQLHLFRTFFYELPGITLAALFRDAGAAKAQTSQDMKGEILRKAVQLTLALAVVFFALSSNAEASTCTISQQCQNGTTVSCSGPAGTCSSGSNYVQCNGQRTYCTQSCSASYRCSYGGWIACSSLTGGCSVDSANQAVSCGSKYLACSDCYPAAFCDV